MSDGDTPLVRRLQDSDEGAWKEFEKTYEGLIYAAITRAGVSGADKDDIYQDVLLCVFEEVGEFKKVNEGSFSSWLYTTAKNRAYDYLRKKSQTGTVHRGDPVDPARLVQETDVETMHGSSPDDPAEQTIGEGIEELVWEAARDIDTKGFQVWKLRRRGLHLKAVSNALDRNYNTVRQQARRFRNALAEELDDRYGLNDMV